MRNRIQVKHLVAVLIPAILLLGVVKAIPNFKPLMAANLDAQLVDVVVDGKSGGEGRFVSEPASLIEINSEKTQILKVVNSENFMINQIVENGEEIPKQKVSLEDLENFQKETDASEAEEKNLTKESAEEKLENKIFTVENENQNTFYLLIHKNEKMTLSVSSCDLEKEIPVVLEDFNGESKQLLFTFKKIISEESSSKNSSENKEILEEETVESQESSTQHQEKMNDTPDEKKVTKEEPEEEFEENEAIKQFLKKDYTEKESFKPIEITEEKIKKNSRSSNPVIITGAKMTIKDGKGSWDGSAGNGLDNTDSNRIVRTFDTITYLLTFSLESTDSGVSYSDIKYRVDMDLPNAFSKDSSGKDRFKGEVVDNENGKLIAEGTGKKSTGYVESTIRANGQVLVPMLVNIYGAENLWEVKPNFKITIVSAKNNETGLEETFDLTYDENNLSALEIASEDIVKVSAKPSVTAKLVKGGGKRFTDVLPGVAGKNANYDVVGTGVTLGLLPIAGRGTADFRGSTFPTGEITVTLESKSFHQPVSGGTTTEVTGLAKVDALSVVASNVSTTNLTGWNRHLYTTGSLALSSEMLALGVPKGKSEEIHVVEPPGSMTDKKEIGVYDTGKIDVSNTGSSSARKIVLKNSDYTPIYNPYTYDLNGIRTSTNEKIFSSSMLMMEWSKEYLASKGGIFSTNLSVANISYEGNSHSVSSTISFSQGNYPSGSHWSPATFTQKDLVSGGLPGLSSTGGWSYSNGDGQAARGQSIYGGGAVLSTTNERETIHQYIRWNANSLEYDLSREIFNQSKSFYDASETRYGVGISQNHPKLPGATEANIQGQYTWYKTAVEAASKGKISAVKLVFQKKQSFTCWSGVPLVVIGNKGGTDPYGNAHVVANDVYWYRDGSLIRQFPSVGENYTPSTFNADGVKIGGHSSLLRDTLYIKDFTINTTTNPGKPVYKTNEIVDWKIEANLITKIDAAYGVSLETTLPKGLSYDYGSAKDGSGSPLPDPVVSSGAGGSTILKWTFPSVEPMKGDIVEVNFTSTPKIADLTFNDISVAEVTTKTVGEMWVKNTPSIKDTSPASQRGSFGEVQLYQIQQIILTKEVDKPLIEVGENDKASSKFSNDVTYKITLENNSTDKLVDVRLLDVLPYNHDSLGTNFNGSYTVKSAKILEGAGDISFTNSSVSETENPNDIFGWGVYVPGVSSATTIRNAKGFLISKAELNVGDKIVFEITISPTGQSAGDIYRNRASFNSKIELPVKSNIVETKVYGRDLTGYVWYDDNYDGLIGVKEDGSLEEPAKNIPVKLYRTSLIDGSYVKKRVDESLNGEKFIDASGDSLVKTDADGKYKFENLPEGEYLAEFIVGDLVVRKVVIVTKQLVGSDTTKNSKADPSDYKTPEYLHPELKDLPDALGSGKYVHHVTDVNAGLTRLSTIRLFKYVEGSAVDGNSDGHLSEEEIEKTATPLKDAEFDLYEGNSTDPADKIGSAKTDEYGWLEYTGLPPGDYTLVETKAPAGYELIKDPIKVTVPKYNHIVKVYVSDSGATLLPFTGGNKAMQIVLVVAGSLMLIGMLGIVHQFYPIKIRKRRIR